LFSTNYGDGSPGITRTYTADGLPETISSGGAVWTNTYNKRRLNESESLAYGGVTYRIGRDYDANGSLAKLTYPDNSAVAYSPNALGEPRQVGTYASGLAYHPSGTVQGFRYGNGITHSMAQNMRGLPEWSEDAGVLKDKYEYDQNANVASIADWQEGITNRGLTYDGLDRLTRANAPSLWGDAFYTYDALDNLSSARLTAGGTARTTTHTVDPATNLLMGVSNSAGAGYNLGYQYDSQGNIVQRGTQTFRFDLANRMTSAVGKGTYLYDGLGHRVSVVGTDGVNRVQVYSQGGQLLYANTSGSALANGTKYVYLHNHVIAEVNGTAVQYDHTDGLGSPVARTDAAARLISRTRYEPYGATAAGAESVIGFAGHVTAADLGLVYMQQRYYDPIAGRFLSIDPVTTDANTGGSFNRYAYGANSPYKYVDPDGRDVVFSVDTKAAGGNGHTTLYFQDKGAAWHAYNQGAAGDAKSSGNLGFLSGQNAKAGVSIEGVSKDSVPKDGLRISTSAKQDGLIATNAEQSAAAHNSGKVEYNLYSNNCTDAAVGVVNSSGAGITVSNPATTVKPNSWIKEVKEDPKAVVRKEESK
jgi:RHS repeat-associated protein